MVKRSSLVRIGLATVLALVLLVTLAQSAFAGISWCDDEDLAPMATIAEQRNAGAAGVAEAITGSYPMPAVSVSKGGSNTHK